MVLKFIMAFALALVVMIAIKFFFHSIEWLGKDTTIWTIDKSHTQEAIEEFLREMDEED